MPRQTLQNYCVAGLTVAVALFTTLTFDSLRAIPSTLFYAAVLITTWYGGRLPGLLSVTLSFATLDLLLVHPQSLLFTSKDNALQMGVFLGVSLLINWLTASRGRARDIAGERAEFTQAIADASPNILYVFDLKEERNIYVNMTVTRLLGYTPDEIRKMGQSLFDELLHEDDLPHLPEHIAKLKACSNGNFVEWEYRIKHRDGSWRWLHSRDRIFKHDDDGEPRLVLGTAQDTTERRRTTEERGRFFDVSDDLLFVAGFDGKFKWVSPAWERALGWSAEEMTSHPWLHFVHPDDHEKTIAEGERLFSGRETVSFENRYLHKDGSYRWMSWKVRPYTEERLLYGAATDVTERRQLEDQFRQSQKLESIGQLAGGIAHDFNNILTVIGGYSDLALRRIPAEDGLRFNLDEIKKAGNKAAGLTRQLLAFSRKQILQPKVIDLNSSISETLNMIRRLIGENIEVYTSLDSTLGKVNADPGQLEQVLINLLVNARDAMPKGGSITIETRNVELDNRYAGTHLAVTPGPYVMLAVSDTGTGMDEETKQRVFDPFFTTKGVGKGTGLGLSTVYGIVKQSGGNIWLYSEVGHGTTFKVYLPRASADSVLDDLTKTTKALPRGTETILLVEDEETVRNLTSEILAEQGYRVIKAPTPNDALEIARKNGTRIDLLLTDVVMPQMGGRDLAEQLSKILPDLPVLYMSGYTDDAIIHHGVLEPGVELLEKPFTAEGLALRVREVLEKAKEPGDTLTAMYTASD